MMRRTRLHSTGIWERLRNEAAAAAEVAPRVRDSSSDLLRVRSDFRYTALWIGQLQTDEQGRASFDLRLPDNVTTWRARARAVTAETQAGEGESELLVTKPLLVRPALPRFLRVGDEVTLRTLVTNRTTAPRNVSVTIQAEGVALDGRGARTARIQPGRSAAFAWPARALEEGTATVRFRATTAGRGADAVELRIPVHLDVTPETTATGGVVEDAPAVEAVYLPDYVITGQGSLEISLQASLVGALDAELGHFLPPHSWESNVRVASRIVALVAVQRANGSGLTDAQTLQLQSDIKALVQAQHYDGGWAWCRTCYRADVWVTGWVLVALGEARDAGYAVPDYQYSQAARSVMQHLSRETDIAEPPDPNQHAFLLYALAKAAEEGGDVADLVGEQADAMQAIVDEHRASLTSWGRAYLVLGLLAAGHEADHAVGAHPPERPHRQYHRQRQRQPLAGRAAAGLDAQRQRAHDRPRPARPDRGRPAPPPDRGDRPLARARPRRGPLEDLRRARPGDGRSRRLRRTHGRDPRRLRLPGAAQHPPAARRPLRRARR